MTATNGAADSAAEAVHGNPPADAAAAATPADTPTDTPATAVADSAALQAQIEALQDQVLRAQAEAENVRRRAQDDVARARKFGIESFAESLVPVRDSLEAALAQPEQTLSSWREGVETTLRQLTSAFERNQLKTIEPTVGDKFDPHCHQAIATVAADAPANTVAQTLQKGYLIADRVLRAALVMVSAGPAGGESEKSDTPTAPNSP